MKKARENQQDRYLVICEVSRHLHPDEEFRKDAFICAAGVLQVCSRCAGRKSGEERRVGEGVSRLAPRARPDLKRIQCTVRSLCLFVYFN